MIPFIIGVLVTTIIFIGGWLVVINRKEKGLPTISVSISGTKEKIKNWGKKVKKDFSDLINGIKAFIKHFFDFKSYSGREKALSGVIIALLSAIAVFAVLFVDASYYKNKLDDLHNNYNLLAEGYKTVDMKNTDLKELLSQKQTLLDLKDEEIKSIESDYDALNAAYKSKVDKINGLRSEIRMIDAALEEQGLYYDDDSETISVIPEEGIAEEEIEIDGGWEDYDYEDDYDYEEDYDDDDYGTVYWTSGGKVYHSTEDCPSLGRSTNIRSGSISESGKSRACKNCY